jgi:hypothetical protein
MFFRPGVYAGWLGKGKGGFSSLIGNQKSAIRLRCAKISSVSEFTPN